MKPSSTLPQVSHSSRGLSRQELAGAVFLSVIFAAGVALESRAKTEVAIFDTFDNGRDVYVAGPFWFCESGSFYKSGRRYDPVNRTCQDGTETSDTVVLSSEEWDKIIVQAQNELKEAIQQESAPAWLQNNLTVVQNVSNTGSEVVPSPSR